MSLRIMGIALSALVLISVGACSGTSRSTAQTAGNPDRFFITSAGLANLAEIRTGQLATERATNPEVRRYAQTMIEQHRKANQELADLARQKGIDLPDRVDEAHAIDATHLTNVSAADFDREYMGLMVAEHAKAVSLFEDKARKAQDADLRAFAQRTLPALQEHLRMAKDLNNRLPAPGAMR